MLFLKIRMWLLLTAMFGIVYAVISLLSYSAGITNFYFYLALSFGIMFLQYLIGPKIVEWTMRVRYIKREEYPELYNMLSLIHI